MSVANNGPSQDSNHPDDLFQLRYVTPGFKPFSYKLSPCKCWSMTIDFLHYNGCVRVRVWPIVIGESQLVKVSSFKELGVDISQDLNREVH